MTLYVLKPYDCQAKEKNSDERWSLYGLYRYGPPKNKLDIEGGRINVCRQTNLTSRKVNSLVINLYL